MTGDRKPDRARAAARRSVRRLGGLLLVLGIVAPVLAGEGPDPEQLERNTRLLQRWRTDPDHYARLRRSLQSFSALPPQRQRQLRTLDRQLHDLDPARQRQLWEVLDRYAAWLEHLPEQERNRVLSTPPRGRIPLIRKMREQEWLKSLPFKVQQDLLALSEEDRPRAVEELRQQERRRRTELRTALRLRTGAESRPDRPAFLADFPVEVQVFVQTTLRPMLAPDEVKRLRDAEGVWPLLPHTILDLSSKHPVLPPVHGTLGVIRYLDLPVEVKRLALYRRLEAEGKWQQLRQVEGKWPDFALAITELLRKEQKPVRVQLGACRVEDFSPRVQGFLNNELIPALSEDEKAGLKKLEGVWPDYPLYVHELARKHQLSIPEMSLPGPQRLWEGVRSGLPEVPDRVLRVFALAELSKEELKSLRISLRDPSSRERLKQAYFRRNPRELARWVEK